MWRLLKKHCAKCGRKKRRTEFYSAKNRPDGLYNYCKPCAGECAKADYIKHRDRKLAYQHAYSQRPEVVARARVERKREYWENRERHLSHAKAWMAANKSRRRQYVRKWNAANRELVRSYQKRHKALKRNASSGELSAHAWRLIVAAFRGRCVYCGKKRKLEQDHVRALTRGGAHAIHNVVPACRHCNATKLYNPPPPFWWTRHGAA